MIAQAWLKADYADIVELIERVEAENAAAGRKTRRNWWDTLSGGVGGRPYTVNGHQFPVLRAAQIRQAKDITPNAICRNPNEVPSDVIATKRWPRRRLPSRARGPLARKIQKANGSQKAG